MQESDSKSPKSNPEMGSRQGWFWKYFVVKRWGRLDSLIIPSKDDRYGQILFGIANLFGLITLIMIAGLITSIYMPSIFIGLILAIVCMSLLRGTITILYYRHIREWKGVIIYSVAMIVLFSILGIIFLT